VPGWSAAVCTDGFGSFRDADDRARRSAYFVHKGTRRISEAEFKAVQMAVLAIPGLRASVGLGGCCSPQVAKKTDAFCLKVWLQEVCDMPLSRIVQATDEALRQRGLEHVRVGVDVMVDGPVGPGSAAADPRCAPLSSQDVEWWPNVPRSSASGCVAGRVRVAEPHQETPGLACAHDGECLVAACGEKCLRWDQPLGPLTCPDHGRLEDAPVTYCGCVSGRCDWFRVAAP